MRYRAHDRYGFLNRLELMVLQLRSRGYSLSEAAKKLGTSKQSVWATEKRAKKIVALARRTLMAFHVAVSRVAIYINPGVAIADIPPRLLEEADKAEVKLLYDYAGLYELLRSELKQCSHEGRLIVEALVVVTPDGRVHIYCRDIVKEVVELAENLIVMG